MMKKNYNRDQFKRIFSFFAAVLLVGLYAAGFAWVWYESYSDAILLPFYRRGNWVMILIYVVLVLLFGSFAIELKYHDVMKASQVSWAFFGGLVVPYLLLSLLRIFQMNYHHGSFIVLLPLLAAWGADTCALFSGMLFGKHKLAPVVSPKKTVEGAVGGVVGGAVLVLIAALIMNRTLGLEMPLWSAVVLGAVGAVLGEIGDLSFSVIKRQTGIKDYGHIFPGHGGVLDRFDSVLFVAPFAELLFRVI